MLLPGLALVLQVFIPGFPECCYNRMMPLKKKTKNWSYLNLLSIYCPPKSSNIYLKLPTPPHECSACLCLSSLKAPHGQGKLTPPPSQGICIQPAVHNLCGLNVSASPLLISFPQALRAGAESLIRPGTRYLAFIQVSSDARNTAWHKAHAY